MSDKLEACFDIGARVEKKSGSSWRGIIVGSYSTDLTPVGWAVESETETGSVQIYPEKALRLIERTPTPEQAGEVENALQELEGSDFSFIREHAAVLRAALQTTPPAQPTADAVDHHSTVALHAVEWLKHLRSDEPIMRHTVADNLERAIQTLACMQEQNSNALVNLNYYIIDLQQAIQSLMEALGNAYHPAYEQGRAVLNRGGK